MKTALPWTIARLLFRPQTRNRMPTDDRRILEEIIFKAIYRQPEFRRLLFVGCHRYSAWYPKLFGKRSDMLVESVDPDPDSARHGAAQHHIRIFQKFQPLSHKSQIDLVLINGVFGYGIDSDDEKNAAMRAAWFLLREGGMLLIGYKDGETCDLDIDRIDTTGFQLSPLPGFDACYVKSTHWNGHSFIGLRKMTA